MAGFDILSSLPSSPDTMPPEIQIQREIDIEKLRARLQGMTDEKLVRFGKAARCMVKPLREPWEASATGFRDSIGRGEERVAKKAPKEFKPGQVVRIKLSNGRIEEACINHVIQHSDRMKLLVDFGHDETALIELW
jgi:hypothetical protein